jgi:tetratricopeptide (TPR) repeat protein
MKSATIDHRVRKLDIWINNTTGTFMSNVSSSFIALLLISLIIMNGCSEDKSRKIRLAGSEDVIKTSGRAGTTVLRFAPEEQKSLVIRYFKNHTGDPSLDWLERGLTDMLITELSQSPYLNIITEAQFLDVANKMGKTNQDLEDRLVEIVVAGKANAQILLTGCISYQKNMVSIQVEATDAVTAAQLKKEIVEGEGLEKLFSMVDDLSGRLRQFLREKGEQQKYTSVKASEMTNSLEAFRCYSKALENSEKYLFLAAEECLEEALSYDSTFAAAYLQLLGVKRSLKKSVNHEELIARTKRYAHKLSYADQVELELIESEMKGEPFKIISILEHAVTKSPMDLRLRFTLAQTYRRLGHEEKAMQEFEEIIEMDPKYKMAFNDLGYLYADMGDFKTALYMLDKYQELAPDEPNPHDSKGEILMFAGKLHEAAEEYKQALKIMPGYYNSAFRLSEIYSEVGDQEKALKYLDLGLQYVPDTGFETSADFNRARIYWRFGNFAKADKFFTKLLDMYPLWRDIMTRQIEMYRSSGKYDYAQKLEIKGFEKFKVAFNKSSDSYKYAEPFMQYVTYSELPLEKIIPILEKIIKENKISDQHRNMGWAVDFCNLYRGRINKAKVSFKKKIPQLLQGFQLRKNEIGWASTWKNLFMFFDDEVAGTELSMIITDNLLNLARKEKRQDLEFIANMAQARVLGQENKKDQYTQLYNKFGVPTEDTWNFCGPFREYTLSGFEHVFPPENEIKLDEAYTSDKQEVKWVIGRDDHFDGHFNLNDLYEQSSFATAYALVYIDSPDKRKVQVRIGSDESCKFWLNDELIWQHYIRRDAVVDRDIVTVVLHPGYNKMLLKITNTDLDWGFYFRVTDETGDGFPDLKFVSADKIEQSLATADRTN